MPLTADEKDKLDKDDKWIQCHDQFFECPICHATIHIDCTKTHTKWHKKIDL